MSHSLLYLLLSVDSSRGENTVPDAMFCTKRDLATFRICAAFHRSTCSNPAVRFQLGSLGQSN